MIQKFCKLLVFLVLIACSATAQVKIMGSVKNDVGEPLRAASVVVKATTGGVAVAYTLTDKNGNFSITTSSPLNSLSVVAVTNSGYAAAEYLYDVGKDFYSFSLQPQATILPTVLVKPIPIKLEGDTIVYDVRAFTGVRDEMIGDVIANLPGVTVGPNGQISYNGKPISHYYIDGIDMLGPRYNIANRNITANLVDKVEVLQRHQDIEMLRDVKASDAVALNLKLGKKAKNKFIGGGSAGAGFTPALYDFSARGLNFRPAFQMITALKANNLGQNIGTETSEALTVFRQGNEPPQAGLQQALADFSWATPPLAAKRFLFNNSFLSHFSDVKLFKKGTQLTSAISYYNDNSKYNNVIETKVLFADAPPLLFTEMSDALNNRSRLEGNLGLTVNTKKRYLKNTFKFKIDALKQSAQIENSRSIQETLKTPLNALSNEFSSLLKHKKLLINFISANFYSTTPQELNVLPGSFNQTVNNGTAYKELLQNAILKSFVTDNSFLLAVNQGLIKHELKASARYSSQKIETSLEKMVTNKWELLADSFRNDYKQSEIKAVVEDYLTIRKRKFVFDANLPLVYQNVNIKEGFTSTLRNRSYLFFNPQISYVYKFTSKVEISTELNKTSTVSGVLQQVPGFIVGNYRSIQRGVGQPQRSTQYGSSLQLKYQNPLAGFFAGASIFAGRRRNDLIYDQTYDGFLLSLRARALINFQDEIGGSARISKYFISSKLNLSASAGITYFNSDILQDSTLAKNQGNTYNTTMKVEYNGFKKLGIASTSKYINTSSSINSDKVSSPAFQFSSFTEFIQFTYTLSTKVYLYNSNEIYSIKNADNDRLNYYFSDVGISKKFKKRKVDLEWNNITNNKKFTAASTFQYINRISTYNIRPSNLVARVSFKF